MRAPMRRGRKSRLKNSPLSSCSLRPSMESGTTGYSPEGQVVEVIFAKNLIEISGEKGQLLGDHAHGFAYLIRGLDRIPLPVGPLEPTVREALRAFVEGLLHDRDFPITVEDGLRAVAVAEACYRSALSGQAADVE